MSLKLFCVPCFVKMRAQKLKIPVQIITDKKGVSFDYVLESKATFTRCDFSGRFWQEIVTPASTFSDLNVQLINLI
jgi:hypothetical protein